ncbi:MAG: hypothetical protein AB1486_05095 [Planctomycetota bacterium]
MAMKANKTVIGAFVVGALALVVGGVLAFGSGALFRESYTFVFRFEGSVKGLILGAPVTLRGFKIGSVSDCRLEYDLDRHAFHTTVVAEMLPAITPTGHEETVRKFEEFRDESADKMREELLTRMVAEGLRAQLAVQSFVTGMLQVELDFHTDAERASLLRTPEGYWELPTIPSSMEQLQSSLQDIPVKEILAELNASIKGLSELINSPEIRESLPHLKGTLESAHQLVQRANDRFDATHADVMQFVEVAQKLLSESDSRMATLTEKITVTLQDVGDLVRNVNGQVEPVASRLGGALDDSRALVKNLNENVGPVVTKVKEVSEATRSTLAEAQRSLSILRGLAPPDAAIAHQVTTTLDSLSGAMDSLKNLLTYLEQHPEALLRGKD